MSGPEILTMGMPGGWHIEIYPGLSPRIFRLFVKGVCVASGKELFLPDYMSYEFITDHYAANTPEARDIIATVMRGFRAAVVNHLRQKQLGATSDHAKNPAAMRDAALKALGLGPKG